MNPIISENKTLVLSSATPKDFLNVAIPPCDESESFPIDQLHIKKVSKLG